jgi:hypothetical protein
MIMHSGKIRNSADGRALLECLQNETPSCAAPPFQVSIHKAGAGCNLQAAMQFLWNSIGNSTPVRTPCNSCQSSGTVSGPFDEN